MTFEKIVRAEVEKLEKEKATLIQALQFVIQCCNNETNGYDQYWQDTYGRVRDMSLVVLKDLGYGMSRNFVKTVRQRSPEVLFDRGNPNRAIK